MIHRTKSNPGPEMSETEKRLRFLVSAKNQAVYAPPDKLANLDAEIAVLMEKMNRPRAQRKESTETPEKDILKNIMKALKKHPLVGAVWRQNSMTAKWTNQDGQIRRVRANTARGMSDIMGTLKDGRTLAIEVKRKGKNAEPHQQAFLDKINASGGLAFVARSVDDVIAKLGE